MSSGPRSVHALWWRQVRFSTTAMALFLLLVIEVGAAAYRVSGGAFGLASLSALLHNPAISALQGRATQLNSAGAFIIWKMGMYVALAIAIFAALLATRLTRSGEDDGSWDLVVVSPAGRSRAFFVTVLTLGEVGAVLGLLSAGALVAAAQSWFDSALYGLAIASVAWIGAALGLVAAQLVAPRRGASQWSLGVLGLTFLLRMVADGSSAGAALRAATPFGWMENVAAFQHRAPVWLVPLVAVPIGLTMVAAALQAGRDVGAARWSRSERRRAREFSLRTIWRFAWRERQSTLWSWSLGLGLLGLTLGYLTHALLVFAGANGAYERLLRRWGLAPLVSAQGFVGETGSIMALVFGFLVVTLVAMVANDVQSGRLDLPLAVGLSRRRWIAAALLASFAGTGVVVLACGLEVWIGVQAGGTAMNAWDPVRAMVNAASPTPLFLGLTMLFVAWRPRRAYVSMALVLGLGYLVATLGPILQWPPWLVASSPFHYLTLVPAQAPNWGAALTFGVLGLVAGGTGLWWFVRHDLAPESAR